MLRKFKLNPQKLIVAILLMLFGVVAIYFLNQTQLVIAGSNYTSIAILFSGLIFYVGLMLIVQMFENETLLAIALLTPSVIAVGIFVYGFIGWSIRVSTEQLEGVDAGLYMGRSQPVHLSIP